MSEKWINRGIAIVFLIVGLMATINTARLHTYINQTLPRDQSQEQCQSELLGVLKGWVAGRYERDVTVDDRDQATLRMLDKLTAGERPSPQDLTVWRDAINADNEKRQEGTRLYDDLPDCTP